MSAESAAENSPCFVNHQPSPYTAPMMAYAANLVAVAKGLASMERLTWNSITTTGLVIPNGMIEVNELPMWKQGFKVSPRGGAGGGVASVLFVAQVLEVIPSKFWPLYPDADPELCAMLSGVLRQSQPLPQTLTQYSLKRLPPLKISRKKIKQRTNSKIWAKGQGNTIWNTMNDYRYRPSFYGIRI